MAHSELRIQMLLRNESQADIGKLLGINQSMVCKRLSGKLKFKDSEKRKLAKHYKKSIEELGL